MSDTSSEHGSDDDMLSHAPCLLEEMVREVDELVGDGAFGIERLYRAGMGGMRKTSVRSLYWKIFLGELSTPLPKEKPAALLARWTEEIDRKRAGYAALKEKHTVNPIQDVDDDDEDALAIDNPLSDHKDSLWSVYFKQEQIVREIEKDLNRMSADDTSLYERPDVKKFLRNVLKTFALENLETGYRQGMHDVLSAFAYHFYHNAHSLAIAPPELRKRCRQSASCPEILSLIDLTIPIEPEHLEADAYLIFDALLNSPSTNLKSWYKVVKRGSSEETPIQRLCTRLQSTILPCYNSKLATHLHKHGVEPAVYALRWFRVWFIREFDVKGSAPLWDAVLCEVLYNRTNGEEKRKVYEQTGMTPLEMGVLPLIGAAMLHFIADDLMERDFSGTLKRLMKYPPVEDVGVFVDKAIEWSGNAELQKHIAKPDLVSASPPSPLANHNNNTTTRARSVAGPPQQPQNNSSAKPSYVTLNASRTAVAPSSSSAPFPGESAKFGSSSSYESYQDMQIREMVANEHELAGKLQRIVDTFQDRWFEHEKNDRTDEERTKAQEAYLIAIAELKQ
eukprot:gene15864-24242_t